MKTVSFQNVKIIGNGSSFKIEGDWFSNYGTFYYSREETKKYHKENMKHGFSALNQAKGLYKQLIGADSEITGRLYTRLVNAYIRGEI